MKRSAAASSALAHRPLSSMVAPVRMAAGGQSRHAFRALCSWRGAGDRRARRRDGGRRGGGDRSRASHAGREQPIDTLKVAFVQDRLTKDEFDLRVGQAFTAQTYAELAAVTADLSAGTTAAQPPSKPARAQAQSPAIILVIIATTVLTAGLWGDGLFTQAKGIFILAFTFTFTFTFAWLGIPLLAGVVMRESRQQNRWGGQLPQRPTPREGGQASRRPAI